MKMILDVKDSKAAFMKELLKSLPFVKAETITPEKAQLLKEIKEAVDDLALIKKGKRKARPAKELLSEL